MAEDNLKSHTFSLELAKCNHYCDVKTCEKFCKIIEMNDIEVKEELKSYYNSLLCTYHIGCFVENREKFNYFGAGEDMQVFELLKAEVCKQ